MSELYCLFLPLSVNHLHVFAFVNFIGVCLFAGSIIQRVAYKWIVVTE